MEKKKNRCKPGDWYGKPYFFFGDHLEEKYQCKVLKLPIDAHFSCPNRDGTLGTGGCIFCSEEGSASPTAAGIEEIHDQMESAIRSFKRSGPDTRFIAYFQAFTNTHAPVAKLRACYDEALRHERVMGLMIGTRPDALPDEVLDLIAGYRDRTDELWLEIGMQSMHDRSLEYLRRRHDHAATRDAILRAAGRGIPVCAHVILGIPHESWGDMMQTALELSSLPVQGVKIHHLHVIAGTPLEELYRAGDFQLPTLEAYVSTVCDFIERLRTDIIIHRLTGDRNEETLVAPRWGMHKGTVLRDIEDAFRRRGTYQGFLVE